MVNPGHAHDAGSVRRPRGTLAEDRTAAQLTFDGISSDVEKFLFYFENGASRATSNEERAMDLSYISGDALNFYFSRFVSKGSISDDGKN